MAKRTVSVLPERGLGPSNARGGGTAVEDPVEPRVLELLARGHANKEIAYELAVSESRISQCLGRVRARLGYQSNVRLIVSGMAPESESSEEIARVARAVRGRELGVPLNRLTVTESDVAAAVIEGRRNADIATARASSPRTVANQLANVYRKLGVGSRRELVVLAVTQARAEMLAAPAPAAE